MQVQEVQEVQEVQKVQGAGPPLLPLGSLTTLSGLTMASSPPSSLPHLRGRYQVYLAWFGGHEINHEKQLSLKSEWFLMRHPTNLLGGQRTVVATPTTRPAGTGP